MKLEKKVKVRESPHSNFSKNKIKHRSTNDTDEFYIIDNTKTATRTEQQRTVLKLKEYK